MTKLNVKLFLLFTTVLLTFTVFAKDQQAKTIHFPELINPQYIVMDEHKLYIVEGTSISIYELDQFKLIKKFGKKGEGPGEFMPNPQSGRPMFIDIQTDKIIVTSLGKISFFTKAGKFLKDLKHSYGSIDAIQPLGNGFIGLSIGPEKNELFRSIVLYDPQLKAIKSIKKIRHHFQPGKGFEVLRESTDFFSHQNMLYIGWDKGFKISLFNNKGNLVKSIRQDHPRQRVNNRDRVAIIQLLKTDSRFKSFFELLKPIQFPEYYPAIREMRLSGQNIYLIGYRERDEKTQCQVVRLPSGRIQKIWLPLRKCNVVEFYPYHFRDGKLYQFYEVDESWELQVVQLPVHSNSNTQ